MFHCFVQTEMYFEKLMESPDLTELPEDFIFMRGYWYLKKRE